MKFKYLKLVTLFFMLVYTASAQKTIENKSESNNKTQSEVMNENKKKRSIWRFAKPEQMFLLLEGKWIFSDMTCEEPYTVTVSDDRKSIKFKYAKPQKWSDGKEHDSFVYKVIEVGSYYIRTEIEEEKRKTDDGKTVNWDFMFFSADEFTWHRTDWEGLNSTTSVKRCPDGKKRTLNQVGK